MRSIYSRYRFREVYDSKCLDGSLSQLTVGEGTYWRIERVVTNDLMMCRWFIMR